MTRISIISIIAILFAQIAGCALPTRSAEQVLGVEIETVPSHRAAFFRYWAEDNEYGIRLRGTVRKPSALVGLMTEQVSVQLVDEEGHVTEEINASMRKRSIKSQSASFSVDLTGKLQGIKVIRLVL